MGVAAYNRGSRALSAQIDRSLPSSLLSMVEDWNSVAPAHDATLPFTTEAGLTMARGNGGWWLTCNITGFGYLLKSPWEIMKAFRVRVVGADETKCEFHCIADATRIARDQ